MNAKLIIASLVLGTSTFAAAAPAAQFARPAQPIVAQPAAWYRPGIRPTVTLASGLQIQNGRTVIAVGSQMGRFGTLKLEANRGRTYVQKVIVKFADGERQVMSLNRTLAGNDGLTLDLNGNRRAIASVAVFGQEMTNGFRRQRAAFSLTAS